MKLFSQRMIGIGVLSLSLAASLKVAAHDWPEATLESRPGSRWWWLGSAVDSANLAKNISEYAKAGIATLEVTPIYGVKGNEANDIPYLSPKWMKMLDIACRKGAKHGIRIELNNGTGWPFGGPDVTKEDAAKKAVFRRVAKPEGAGDTIILEIANTMQKVKRAAPGGEGLVVDHLDKGAVGCIFQNSILHSQKPEWHSQRCCLAIPMNSMERTGLLRFLKNSITGGDIVWRITIKNSQTWHAARRQGE